MSNGHESEAFNGLGLGLFFLPQGKSIAFLEVGVKLDTSFDSGSNVGCDLWVGVRQHGF